jgi:hypothetical protein
MPATPAVGRGTSRKPRTLSSKIPRRVPYGASEAEILKACLQALSTHPKVLLVSRRNSGSMASEGRYVRFARHIWAPWLIEECVRRGLLKMRKKKVGKGYRWELEEPAELDISGTLEGGQQFAIEIKASGKYATLQQRAWILCVQISGGLAGVARSVEDATWIIEQA